MDDEERASRDYEGQARALREDLAKKFPRVAGPQIDNIFAAAQDHGDMKSDAGLQYLFMKAHDRGGGAIPVARLRFDRRLARPVFRIEVCLFQIGSKHATGIRFETPESSAGEHAYYHAQFFVQFDGAPTRVSGIPDLMPTRQPALPLDARSEIGLLVNALVSIYGLGYLDVLARQHPGQLPRLLKGLHLYPPPSLPAVGTQPAQPVSKKARSRKTRRGERR